MADVTVTQVVVPPAISTAQTGSGAALAAGDVGHIPNASDILLRVANGATVANLSIAAAPGHAAGPLTFQVAANKTAFFRVNDSTHYVQADDTLWISSDQAITSIQAITR